MTIASTILAVVFLALGTAKILAVAPMRQLAAGYMAVHLGAAG